MPKKYPPLTPKEVVAILIARGLGLDRQDGSHAHYEGFVKGKRVIVTVDMSYPEFDDKRIKTMIAQSGLTREEFYRANKATARKIGLRKADDV